MKEPKFKIGDVFFVTGRPEAKQAPESHLFIHTPYIYVITEIHQTKKKISYTLKQYQKTTKGFVVNNVTGDEDILIKKNYARTLTEKMERIHKEIIEQYNELVKEVNKEKLTDVLNS